jgi:outer membrane protein assembly factor BamB
MNAMSLRRYVVGICAVLLGAPSVWAQDWPQWLGPNRDAKASGFQAPATWPKQLTPKWNVSVGDGVSTPALVGDRLYVFTRQGGDEVLRCLDAASGKELWQEKYASGAATGPSGQFPGPRSSPTVADGKVVTLGVRGTLSCVDAATGKKVWRKDDIRGTPMFFTASSPLVVDGLCIAQLGGPKEGALVAYDLATGDEKWRWNGGGPGYASPVALSVDGTKLIVAETDSKVVAVNAKDGKLVWETPFPTRQMVYNASTPVVEGQTVLYGGGGGRGEHAVRFEKEGDRIVGKEVWKNPQTSVQFNTPVLKNGLLFGLTQDNQLFAVNAETGKTAWTAPVGPQAAGGRSEAAGGGRGGRGMRGGGRGGPRPGYGSIVDAGTVLLALTPSSELIVFQPSDKQFTEVARIKVAATPTYAYPVVSGNRLFIKDQDSVALWVIE